MVNEAAQIEPPRLGEPYLLTPGPLTTSYAVKQEMLRDWGSRDSEFRDMTEQLRDGLLDMLGDARTGYDCVPIQGSGSFAVEAMLGSLIPREGKVLVLINGAYGKRIAAMLDYLGRDYVVIDTGNYEPPRGPAVTEALAADPAITDVIVVHCETSTGILNPIAEISRAVYDADRRLFIDSMSAFGAIPLNGVRFEALVSSAQKFDMVRDELKSAWVARMRAILSQVGGRVILLWLAEHAPDKQPNGETFGADPLFVDRDMIEQLAEFNVELVEVVATPEAVAAGQLRMVFTPLEQPKAHEMLGPVVHEAAARALSAQIAAMH